VSEPTYEDWLRAIPVHRRDIFATHFEIGRARMQQAFESGDNLHDRNSCPCMRHNESREFNQARDAFSGISR
jgi:hypothetical protein